MNEFTIMLVLLIAPLSSARNGVADITMTITQPEGVLVIKGAFEYQKSDAGEVFFRLEFSEQLTIVANKPPSREKLETVIIVRANREKAVASFQGLPGEDDSSGPFNFGPHLVDPTRAFDFKTLSEPRLRLHGVLEKAAVATFETAQHSDRITCFTAHNSSPAKNAWLKQPHVVSGVLQWKEGKPDAARFGIPIATK
ncbi:hypothetical protein ETAA8_29020 [Anatilimnocola aggregata]|uniref:Uncharacterized protein n=1 Tax=Anatilimnocola aggregata TaxID=2528021 RepID=A0A517YC74_9BACT|nr:hypothetical protein [Anatilimnocola aggregata]QDU27811.1 hypothetical protein ETAA8_29020 [Anatilimnocola aggregata]